MYTAVGTQDRQQWIEQYAPLVKRIAHHMMAKLPPCIQVEDMIQAGMIGLLDAINRYTENQGAQFETYAAQRIRGAMLDELRQSDWLPRSLRKNLRRIETAMNVLEQRLRRPPTEQELAHELDMPLSEYQEMLQEARGYQLVYYDDFDDEEDGNFLDRHLPDPGGTPLDQILDSDLRSRLTEAIKELPERERLVMALYYEQELNLKEIGATLNVSESRVCQLHTQAIARLRAKLRDGNR